MDLGTLEFASVFSLLFALAGMALKKDVRLLFAFIGGLLALFVFLQTNADGSITNAYAYSGGYQNSTVGIWPFAYIPLMLVLLNWGILTIEGVEMMK